MKNEIDAAIEVLKKGGLILYPTDTVWGIGCDASNAEAVDKIYQLKQRSDSKALICLVSEIDMLERHVNSVPPAAYGIIKSAEHPTTVIYDEPVGVASNLVAEDNSLAIRVARDEFCQKLIGKFGKAIVSTSANISGEPTPGGFEEISVHILEGVDYVVNLQSEKKTARPSSIIRLKNDGTVTVIR